VTRRPDTRGFPLKSHVTRGGGEAVYGNSIITVSPSFRVRESRISPVTNSGGAVKK
jgi:hypothetical protein